MAGHTDDTTQTLIDLLKDNYESHHIFFTPLRYHNHIIHHLLAIYAMGAKSELLEAAYSNEKPLQLPAITPPEPITADNYMDHLGDDDYYQAYCSFFANTLLDKGVTKTLEEYIFSKTANYDEQRGKDGKKQPEMLGRFFSRLIHPLIHTGYGLEFGIMGIVAEGLAQAAVHDVILTPVIPLSYWDDEIQAGDVKTLASRVSHLALDPPPMTNGASPELSRAGEVSIFNVFALMQKDDRLSPRVLGLGDDELGINLQLFYRTTHETKQIIQQYAEMWSLDIVGSSNVESEVERKIEELAWGCVLIYGLGGWKAKDHSFAADFVFVHVLNASLFLPSIVAYLPPYAIQILLRVFFSEMLCLWVAKGRTKLNIDQEYLAAASAFPQEPTISTPHKPAKNTLTPQTITPNSWLAITQSMLLHPEEHACKAHRTLMHWASLFGSRPAGTWVSGKEEDQLVGIELLDGTIFARVAGLTVNELGWMREGQAQGQWALEVDANP